MKSLEKDIEDWAKELEQERREHEEKMSKYSQEHYNEKYDLEPDPITPEEEFLQRDQRFRGFKGDITIETLQEELSHIKLIPPVPNDVKNLFQNAKKIFITAYFDYDLFSHACHYSLFAIESALRKKHEEIFGKSRGDLNMKNAYSQLIDKGVIPQELEWLYESSYELRNEFSHPDFQAITGPNVMYFQRSAEAINHLWDD